MVKKALVVFVLFIFGVILLWLFARGPVGNYVAKKRANDFMMAMKNGEYTLAAKYMDFYDQYSDAGTTLSREEAEKIWVDRVRRLADPASENNFRITGFDKSSMVVENFDFCTVVHVKTVDYVRDGNSTRTEVVLGHRKCTLFSRYTRYQFVDVIEFMSSSDYKDIVVNEMLGGGLKVGISNEEEAPESF